MAELKLKFETDLIEDDGEGRMVMKMQELHIHLPTPANGIAYEVQRAGDVAIIQAKKTEV